MSFEPFTPYSEVSRQLTEKLDGIIADLNEFLEGSSGPSEAFGAGVEESIEAASTRPR